jgi:creatinine amidohydrolase
MQLSKSTWTDADTVDTDLAVVPVGSTEQHGPHAPLSTDTITAAAVAAAGVQESDESAVITPAIPVGVAEEHRQFTGTLWVSPATFRRYVRETIESLAEHGWDRVVIVNGHGGNVDALREVGARLTRDDDAYVLPFTWFDAIDPDDVDESLSMGHGGAMETSVVRHLRPELVNEDRLDGAFEGAAETWGEWHAGVNLAYDSAAFSENGVIGDPRESSPAYGEALLEFASAELASLLERIATSDTSPPDHR